MAENSSKSSIFERLVPVLVLLSIALAFMVGVLWQKVSNLEKGGSTTTTTQPAAQQAAAPSKTVDINTVKGLFDKNLVKFGDKNKKVLFVEITDPSCPYCHVASGKDPDIATQMGTQFKYVSAGGTYQPPVTEIKKLVDSGKAGFVSIYFPGHGNGEMGMKALYCANDQGKYWQAHDLVYSFAGYNLMNTTIKNDKTQSGKLVDFLKGVVDSNALKTCLDSGKYDSRLTDDQNLATTLGVAGTPGFMINSTRFDGAYSFKDMQSTVDAALK